MRILSGLITGIAFILLVQIPAANAFPFFYPYQQSGVGHIYGKITGDLEPVAGAEVALMQRDELIDKTITDEHGNYAFHYINPGAYDVKVTKADYRTSIIVRIPVSQGHTTYNDLYLPKFNNEHMDNNPVVESYYDNFHKYMMHRKSFHPKK